MPLAKSQQTKEVKYYIKTLNHNFWLCIDGFCQPNIVWKQDKTCATKFLLSEAQSLIKALEPFANISQICIEPINKVWYLERRHAGYNYVFEGAGKLLQSLDGLLTSMMDSHLTLKLKLKLLNLAKHYCWFMESTQKLENQCQSYAFEEIMFGWLNCRSFGHGICAINRYWQR